MSNGSEQRVTHNRNQGAVADYAARQLSRSALASLQPFLDHYFAQVDAEDIQERTPRDLFGAVQSHYQLAHERAPGTPIVRVYNPRLDEHGWESAHTIVEIVNDDMPFLVDSVTMELNRQGLALHLSVHPQMHVQRDAGGKLLAVLPAADSGTRIESFIHMETDRISDAATLAAIERDLRQVLDDVRHAVVDWSTMQQSAQRAIVATEHAPYDADEIAETRAFLTWLLDNHFTLLGYREYDIEERDGRYLRHMIPDTGLGLLREKPGEPATSEAPREARQIIEDRRLVLQDPRITT